MILRWQFLSDLKINTKGYIYEETSQGIGAQNRMNFHQEKAPINMLLIIGCL